MPRSGFGAGEVTATGVKAGSGATETVQGVHTLRVQVWPLDVAYMSPEQVASQGIDPHRPVSFGAVLYEMATEPYPSWGSSGVNLSRNSGS